MKGLGGIAWSSSNPGASPQNRNLHGTGPEGGTKLWDKLGKG